MDFHEYGCLRQLCPPTGVLVGWQTWEVHVVEKHVGQESTPAPTQICNENMGKSSLGLSLHMTTWDCMQKKVPAQHLAESYIITRSMKKTQQCQNYT